MFDLHRHDEYSTFDGFGKASELAKIAKEKGHNALCITNHGNSNGFVKTHLAAKKEGLKAILGIEGYFLPKVKEKNRGFHLILIAKDLKGYGNLNRIQFEGEKQKYYNSIWDFKLLEKYSEGLICTTACVAGYLSQCIIKNDIKHAEAFIKKMVGIFGDDFYIEIQPYKLLEEGLQEKVNVGLIKLAKKHKVKCILTSDSHRGLKEEFDSYIKMHEIANHDIDFIESTYGERYMPTAKELMVRFYKMHKSDFGDNTKKLAKTMIKTLDEIYDKCEGGYIDKLELKLPKLYKKDSSKIFISKVKEGLKARGKYTKEYIERCKEEVEVINYHGFEDYFMIVADYTIWAKKQGITVGPGRGSVCNSLVAYALGITEVDSLFFDLDFRRFLRKDKSSFPDIDLDFQTSRRHEVIEYICNKYKGHSARICSYGLYRVDNLVNDLVKVCGDLVWVDDDGKQKSNVAEIKRIKELVNKHIDGTVIAQDELLGCAEGKEINRKYDNILEHFCKLFLKVRYVGTHASGVAVTGGNILDYMTLRIDKNGDYYTVYDLSDLEDVNIIKFDILGLKTMESIGDLRKATGVAVDYEKITQDKKLLKEFREKRTDGIFQFEKGTARGILSNIQCDSFNDVVAASAMNRPGPLSLKQPDLYASNKSNIEDAKLSPYFEYTKESYGTIIYQEQVQRICVNIAKMNWADADKTMKLLKRSESSVNFLELYERDYLSLERKFIEGSRQTIGMKEDEAKQLFSNMTCYTFNKGHSVGYSLISIEEMFYKFYYPAEYWFSKLKYSKNDSEFYSFCCEAVNNDLVVFLPHVNYSLSRTNLRKVDGEKVIQQGLSSIKNVGEKAAEFIQKEREENGIFRSYDDFYDRCKSRVVTSRVIDVLKEQGALEFKKKTYLNRVIKYNSSMLGRTKNK